jgi:hypothetical protein
MSGYVVKKKDGGVDRSKLREPVRVDPPVAAQAEVPAPAPSPTKKVKKVDPRHGPVISMKQEYSLIDLIKRWRRAPWLFVRECLGLEPDMWQDQLLHALIESGQDKFALKACKGPGKTAALAWIGLWFLTCYEDAKIICTSVTGENLRDGLWTEFALWINKSKLLGALFTWQVERIYLKERPETWYISARTWPKDADKTKQANTLAGIHSVNSLMLIDEGGDIPEGVVAAGLAHHATQGGKVREYHYTVMAGNPTRLDGALGIACTRDRAKWWVKEITGDPNAPDRAPRIDKQWAQEQIDTWGADNPWVLVNVFGKFPPTQANKLLGPDQVHAAMKLHVAEQLWKTMPKVMGLDVARSLGADRSVLCRRQGPVVFPFKVWRIDDLMELCSAVAFEWARWKADAIFVDMTGLGGGVVDRMRQLGMPVVGINFGQNPSDIKRFADKRSEMWWNMCTDIRGSAGVPNIALPTMPELVAELTAPGITFNDRGKLKLDSKDKLKKEGLSSPDIADSLALTWAEPVAMQIALPQSTKDAMTLNRAAFDYNPYEDKEEEPYGTF